MLKLKSFLILPFKKLFNSTLYCLQCQAISSRLSLGCHMIQLLSHFHLPYWKGLPWGSSLSPQSFLGFELRKPYSGPTSVFSRHNAIFFSDLLQRYLYLKIWGIKIKHPKRLLCTDQSPIFCLAYGSPEFVSSSFHFFPCCATNHATAITYHPGGWHVLTNPKLQEYTRWLLIPVLGGW